MESLHEGAAREMLLYYKEALKGLQILNHFFFKILKTGQYIESHYYTFFVLQISDMHEFLQNRAAHAVKGGPTCI
jgi:hypothetical protein